ncbi:MAG TPA: hypothetical protein VIS99_10470 [Terrimicrobiaceae bacterium]
MFFQPARDSGENSDSAKLSELEIEAIEMFINFLRFIGLQRSVAEIYGLLFVSSRPLCMEEIMKRLDLSLGAASQGLRLLRNVGAVRAVYSPGARRGHFAADLELSKFTAVIIKEELSPRITRALKRIQHMESLLAERPIEEQQAAGERLDRLKDWLEKSERLLPRTLRSLTK